MLHHRWHPSKHETFAQGWSNVGLVSAGCSAYISNNNYYDNIDQMRAECWTTVGNAGSLEPTLDQRHVFLVRRFVRLLFVASTWSTLSIWQGSPPKAYRTGWKSAQTDPCRAGIMLSFPCARSTLSKCQANACGVGLTFRQRLTPVQAESVSCSFGSLHVGICCVNTHGSRFPHTLISTA